MKDNKKSKVGIYIGVAVFVCIAAVFFLTKSGTFKKLVDRFKGDKAEEWAEDPENTSDWMSEDYESGVTLYVFRMDGETYTVDGTERVEVDEQLEDGRFYKLVADVTFLNGGVAGYYNYPQIEQVLSCDEIEPSDLKLPAISEKIYGLVNIGDYADGDILFNNYYEAYVWEDGEWIWK
ncbi:MAG: hypothetical protein K6B28_09625, partial [Lachnospiraceae bacterium]|nr:hypothetical protein [Lachnospiraceae bacterium]